MNHKDKTVGLITYHSAYNFGSVLQTYGTVRTIEELGYTVETIDYRTPSSILWYQTDFSRRKGLRSMIDNFGFEFIVKKDRKKRAAKFESFIRKFLKPTKECFKSYEQIKGADLSYDILVSGSDQVWNSACGEFRFEPKDAILPFFLQFGKPSKRVAYASSFGNQTLRNIRNYKGLLLNYDCLSTREPLIKGYIEQVTERNVELVCDPTWLLTREQWLALPGIYLPKVSRPYILVYALYWDFRALKVWLPQAIRIADRNGWDVYCISPLNYHSDKKVKMLQDAGPLDFLSYLANAALVVTNTFHGTIFSMNFEVPFYSCDVAPGSRQGQMLAMCGLDDRIINFPNELGEARDLSMNFERSSEIISALRASSKEYIKNALS